MRRVLAGVLAACAASCTLIATFDDFPPGESNVTGEEGGVTAGPDGSSGADDSGVVKPGPPGSACGPPDAGGATVLQDDLTTDHGMFAAAPGFPAASWTYNAGYVQTRLDAADVAIFTKDQNIREAVIDVTAATTETGEGRRFVMVTVGTKATETTFSAIGCAAEVDPSALAQTFISILKVEGPLNALKTTVVKYEPRFGFALNEEFPIQTELRNGKLTCRMRGKDPFGGGEIDYDVSADVGDLPGAVGFYTRQTKARFKNVSICKLK